MLFNSNGFLFGFLPIVLLGFFVLAQCRWSLASLWLALASLVFYGWWAPKFLVLLMASVIINYTFGRWLHQLEKPKAKWVLTFAIVINIGALGFFKYTNFLIATANHFLQAPWPFLQIILPLGISFFTFTQIAFLVDVYRGEAAEYNFIHYLLFVTYFPHLIAGPILHHKQMMPQFASAKTYTIQAENLSIGASIFIIGLTKKTLLADGFSVYATPVFDAVKAGVKPTFIMAWTGALAYALQLYFDFSGYSDMAVGLSRLFGIHLPINFYSPYKSPNIIEFWRRWHISLSQFLRDYLYFALGGNRRGKCLRYINLLITMLLGGLWHGANWTFVIWGGLHGFLLMLNHGWRGLCASFNWSFFESICMKGVSTVLTFLVVVIAWVFFRADQFNTAFTMIAGLFGKNGLSTFPVPTLLHGFSNGLCALFDKKTTALDTINQGYFLGPLAIGLLIVWFLPNSVELFQNKEETHRMIIKPRFNWQPSFSWAFFMMFILLIDFIKNFGINLPPSPFLYFQF